jgi:hypothetical protein
VSDLGGRWEAFIGCSFSRRKIFKQMLVLALSLVLVHLICSPKVIASPLTEKEAKFAEKVRGGSQKLGTGKDAP